MTHKKNSVLKCAHQATSVAQYDKKERGDKVINHNDTPKNTFSRQRNKDSKLSTRLQNVCNELKKGKRSVTQLTIILGYCDPRSYIRTLRNKGIIILDEWIKKDDTRFKRYWIEPEKDEEPHGLMRISEVMDCMQTKKGVPNE